MPIPFLIPIAWGLGTLLLGSAVGAIIKSNPDFFSSSDRVRLSVLGLNRSGKTTLQDFLRNTSKVTSGGTVVRGEKVNEVRLTYNDKTIVLLEGIDPSGSEEGLRLHIEKEVLLSDKIFFLIKGDDFWNEDSYKKENRALLTSIVKKMNEYNTNSKIWIYITHKDKIKEKREDKIKLQVLNFLLKNDRENLNMKDKIEKVDVLNLTSYVSLNSLKKDLFKTN